MQRFHSTAELQPFWCRFHQITMSEQLLHFQSLFSKNRLTPSSTILFSTLPSVKAGSDFWMNKRLHHYMFHFSAQNHSDPAFAESTALHEPFYFILSESSSWEVQINTIPIPSFVLNHNSIFQPAASLSSAIAATHQQAFTSHRPLTLIWLIFYHSQLVQLSVWLQMQNPT